MVCILAFVLPVAFVFSVAARRTVPPGSPSGTLFNAAPGAYGEVVWTDADAWPGKRILTVLQTDPLGSLTVEFMFRELPGPDVLAYWVPSNWAPGDRLPANAQLLGAFLNGEILPLAGRPRGEPGRFVLYSLANHQIVSISKPMTLPQQ